MTRTTLSLRCVVRLTLPLRDTECQTAKKEIVASMFMPGSIAVSLATSCSFPSVSTWTKAHAGLSYIAADTDFLGR